VDFWFRRAKPHRLEPVLLKQSPHVNSYKNKPRKRLPIQTVILVGAPLHFGFGAIALRLLNLSQTIRKAMSRIFGAFIHAPLNRPDTSKSNSIELKPGKISDRRKSKRWPFDISVYVYGHGPGKETFYEEAHTLNVSADGALLLLSVPVQSGQRILLTNQDTEREMDCRVVYLGTKHSRTVETGIVFPTTNSDFWEIHRPPTGNTTS